MTMPVLALVEIFGQHFEWHDLFLVGFLVVLEGVLSIDNALVLGLLARRLPEQLQKKALMYGLAGAFLFRLLAISVAAYLLSWNWAKAAGGGYLIWVAVKHFLFEEKTPISPTPAPGKQIEIDGTVNWRFWQAVIAIEFTDVAFAVDSIVAAIGLVGNQEAHDTGAHDKLWIVLVGGFIGVVIMRFAAVLFIRLLRAFPRFELAAYLLVTVIGGKLLVDWSVNLPRQQPRVDFHSYHDPAFWVFWGLMALAFGVGFIKPRNPAPVAPG